MGLLADHQRDPLPDLSLESRLLDRDFILAHRDGRHVVTAVGIALSSPHQPALQMFHSNRCTRHDGPRRVTNGTTHRRCHLRPRQPGEYSGCDDEHSYLKNPLDELPIIPLCTHISPPELTRGMRAN